jgi:hypothetical protein
MIPLLQKDLAAERDRNPQAAFLKPKGPCKPRANMVWFLHLLFWQLNMSKRNQFLIIEALYNLTIFSRRSNTMANKPAMNNAT